MRDPHDIRHGDTWEVRNGRAVVVASKDWPPPSPETRLYREIRQTLLTPCGSRRGPA